MKKMLVGLLGLLMAGCSVVGKTDVESAPYTLIDKDLASAIELRRYDSLVLVSAPMAADDRNQAFRKLFKYITGDNTMGRDIAMTAPVMMQDELQNSVDIDMTSPVLINEKQGTMSFVMPSSFSLANTPTPTDLSLSVSELKDYKVAAITFNGTMNDRNVARQTKRLFQWVAENEHIAVGKPVTAAYNGPLTLPYFRKNEVFVPIL